MTRHRALRLVGIKATHEGDLNRFSGEGEGAPREEGGEREAKGRKKGAQQHWRVGKAEAQQGGVKAKTRPEKKSFGRV